jgi:hypothetical protein
MKIGFSQKIFERRSNITCNKNPSSNSPVVPCARADGHDERVAVRNFANAPYKTDAGPTARTQGGDCWQRTAPHTRHMGAPQGDTFQDSTRTTWRSSPRRTDGLTPSVIMLLWIIQYTCTYADTDVITKGHQRSRKSNPYLLVCSKPLY